MNKIRKAFTVLLFLPIGIAAAQETPVEFVTLKENVGGHSGDRAGKAVAYAGDVDGDGWGDYVIGIPGYDVPATSGAKTIKDAGRVEVISGLSGTTLMFVNGDAANDGLGAAVSVGNVSGDGNTNLIIGVPGYDAPGRNGMKNVGMVKVLSIQSPELDALLSIRQKVVHSLTLAESAKAAVMNGYEANGMEGMHAAAVQWNANSVATSFVSRIVISESSGVISIEYNVSAIPQLTGSNILMLTPSINGSSLGSDMDGVIEWACASYTHAFATGLGLPAVSGSVPPRYAPKECT